MSNILNRLVTDRNQTDVSEWLRLRSKGYGSMSEEEKAKWVAGMRGAYNASDLNRVTEAMVYLAELYRQYGYAVNYTPINITHEDGTTDTTWRLTDIPTDAQMAEFLAGLCSFWAAVETAEMTVEPKWEDSGYGYVNLDDEIAVGEYAILTAAHGVKSLTVTITSAQMSVLAVSGNGWTVVVNANNISATYIVPQGVYEDLQSALDHLVLICNAEAGDFADATVSISANLRSGAVFQLGTGTVSWSGIINWAAFEDYGFTWEDVHDRELTWEQLETLPIPSGGDMA